MSKYKYLIKNLGLFTLSSISTKLITFFLLPLYTYYLTTEEYGTTDLVNTTVQLFLPILTLSIIEAVLRFALDHNENKKNVFSIGLCITVLSSLVILSISPLLGFIPGLEDCKLFLCGIYVVTAFNSLFSTFARTIDQVKIIAVASIISTLITCGLNILLISYFHLGLNGYFWSLILGNLIGCIVYFIWGRYYRYISYRLVDKALLKRMLLYCIPMIPNALFWWANSSINRYFLTAMVSVSAVGLFAAASKIPSMLNMVTSIFQQAWSVSAIQEYQSEESSKFFSRIYEVYHLCILAASCFLILFSKWIGLFLLQKEFYEAWIFVPWLVLGFYYSALNTFYGTIYTASKKTKFLFTTTILGTFIGVVFNLIFIPFWGVTGASIDTCISHFVVWIARVLDSKKILHVDVDQKCMISSQIGLFILVLLVSQQVPYSFYLGFVLCCVIAIINLPSVVLLLRQVMNRIRNKSI